MLGSPLRMLQFRRGMDGPFLSTKQGGLSDFVPHTMQFLVSSYGTTAVFSYSKNKPERKRALLYTLICARAFGIFCCSLQFVSHTWQFVLYISFRLQQLNRKMAYCCIRWCSLVLSPSSPVSAWFGTTYLAVRRIHITSCQIDHEHHVVEFLVSYSFFVFKN